MEDAMVSSSTGAMNSVLTKLVTLTWDRYAELTGADKQELMMLRHELQVMNALIKQLSDMADLDIQMKGCRNQMRGLTYVIEDSIDDLLSVKKQGSGSTGKRVMPHGFIEQISKLNEQVEKAHLGNTVHRTEKRSFGHRHMPREQLLSYYVERVKPCVEKERDQPSVETMRKTFTRLSSDMKTCLLYLSSFPASHVIGKDRLIRRWAAEGFLPKISVESLLETGERYFLELIDRKLIEPVYDYDDDVLLPTSCKVGDSVHGFITALSSEENFVKPGKDGVFWQISGDIEQLAALFKELSNVRSLTIHTDFGYQWWMHDLSAFKHLRVLDFEDTSIALDEEDLRVVGHLSLLRYLGLAGAPLTSVPQEIIALEHLETVDLGRTTLRCHPIELPAFKIRKIVSLIAECITLQEVMGEMQVLEELATVLVGDDGDRLAKLVNQTKRLRKLDVIFDHPVVSAYGRKGLMELLGEIGNSDIRSLRLLVEHEFVLHLLLDYWAQQRPHHFQKLELTIYGVLEVPRNISASLIDLTHLSISVGRVDTEGLCILGNLPNLVFLSLVPKDMTERSIISKNGFRCLRVLWYDCSRHNVGMGLQFEAGAMPQLRRLRLDFDVRETESKFGSFNFGIQFLTCLVQVHATIYCDRSTAASVEAAIRDQVSQIPYNPLPVHDDDLRRKEAAIEADSSSSTPSVDIRISILPESSSHLPIPGFISFVTEDAMVSSSTGAMNSVLTKLVTLTGERYAELTDTDKQELIMLRDELQIMNALLKKMSDTADLDIQMKGWRNQMRELTYVIEDSIDDLLSVKKQGCESTGKRVIPHSFIEQIRKVKAQVKKADLGSMVGRTEKNEEGSGSTGKRVMPHGFIEQIQNLKAQVAKAHLGSTVCRTEKCTFGPRHIPREQRLSYYDERMKPCVQRDEPSVETMRKTFAHLSSDMKTCLLYLSSFPANHVVGKDRLIRRWVAEGFLPKRSVESLLEIGESYFLELIDTNLIEPVYDGDEDILLPTSCKVGDSVHGFITALSSEENFVKPGKDGVFWRISGDITLKQRVAALYKKLPKARSLTIDTDVDRTWKRDLSAFKHLRVLDLEGMRKALDEEDLRVVGHLSLLRYLGLAGAPLTSVPQEIIALEHLETVDLGRTTLRCHPIELPAFKSRKLVSLIAGSTTLPYRMGEMQVLEELAMVFVREDGDRLAKVVNQSKRLRRLDVIFDPHEVSEYGRKGLMDLLGEIGNSDIRSLRLLDVKGSVLHLLLDSWAQQRPRHFQKLELTIYGVLEVPRNMSNSLVDLTHLSISVGRVDTEGLCILGNLPSLVFLNLRPRDMIERSIINKNGFRCLRVFWYDCSRHNVGMGLQFEAGAMRQLRRLRLDFDVRETWSKFGSFNFGIQFLTCLVQVRATIYCYGTTAASVEAVEAAMRHQVSKNRNNPMLEIITRGREGGYFKVEDNDPKSSMFLYGGPVCLD